MTDKKHFGSYIKAKRMEKNYSQKELAEELFVSEGAVSKWERGISYPDITLIGDICRILDISEHEFITASNDTETRKIKVAAKKWSTLVTAWDLFFYIGYGITLLTCFIVNLCVNKKLDWFFVVLAALILAATFTTTPKFIKKYKLLINVAIQFSALLLLLLVCGLYTQGDWFWVASCSVLLGVAIIFVPICISVYNLPAFIKRNNAILSVCVDFVLLTVLMMVIYGYTNSNTNWVFSIYLPIGLFVMLLPLVLIGIIKYTRLNKFLKAGLSVLSSLAITCAVPYFVWYVLQNNHIDGEIHITLPNFADWSNGEMIASNTVSIVIVSVFIVAAVCIILGLRNTKDIRKQ